MVENQLTLLSLISHLKDLYAVHGDILVELRYHDDGLREVDQ